MSHSSGASNPSMSIVPMTGERSSGLATNGDANDDASAHPYKIDDDFSLRLAAHDNPPLLSIQSIWSASMIIVATPGVFSVWFERELSTHGFRSRIAGIHRPDALIRSMPSIAGGG